MNARYKIPGSDRVVEILALLALLGAFYPLLFLNKLGEGVLLPVHYNTSGQVDGWGGKWFLWLLPLIATVFYAGLSLLGRYPRILNYPREGVATRDESSALRLVTAMLRYMKLLVLLIFAYLNNISYLIAIGERDRLNGVVMIVLLGGLFLVVLLFTIRIGRLAKTA
ncbi:MAG: DUF1648 domain-containing protein [Odoribacteraceae bacterium]|jgi:hypothetical protein|nr:DUF1648 domain-containing protein [Odoribacteraceae bacterium]